MGLRESIWSLLTGSKDVAPTAVLELVREAMLDTVDQLGDERHLRLGVRIELAPDLSTLWYLRPEVMHMVASVQGEAAAQRCLSRLTQLFGPYHLGGKAKALHS